MTKKISFTPIVAAWLLLQTIALPAYADPVTLPITSGLLNYPFLNEARLQIQFPSGSARIVWADDADEWHPDFDRGLFSPGMRLDLSADESFSRDQSFPFFAGEIEFDSEPYSLTSVSFSVVALRDIRVPVLAEGEGEIFTGIPFTFRGTISGSTSSSHLVLNLTGAGHAAVSLEGLSPTMSFLGDAFYEFEANQPSPVPEPGTWLLVATGLLARALREHAKASGRPRSEHLAARLSGSSGANGHVCSDASTPWSFKL